MADGEYARALNQHYGRGDLGAAIVAALGAAGKDPNTLTPDDLAPVDQFHIRGQEATLELVRLAELEPGAHVLDVGGGLGGPARTLAVTVGCRVTVLDLTEEYCRVGADLTQRAGLADRVSFRHGDALALPFEAGSFDAVWTQHSSMNIADKEALYREAHRVLRPGGRIFASSPDAQRWVWDDYTHRRPFTRKSFRLLFADQGFEVERCGYESVAPGTGVVSRRTRRKRRPRVLAAATWHPFVRRNVWLVARR
jgi:ubiquinone/menaquinone biosynthesis C-methylase UbiE